MLIEMELAKQRPQPLRGVTRRSKTQATGLTLTLCGHKRQLPVKSANHGGRRIVSNNHSSGNQNTWPGCGSAGSNCHSPSQLAVGRSIRVESRSCEIPSRRSINVARNLNPHNTPHQSGRLAQLARAPRLHRGSRGFESLIAHSAPRTTVSRSLQRRAAFPGFFHARRFPVTKGDAC
jgi:hypothetical protein